MDRYLEAAKLMAMVKRAGARHSRDDVDLIQQMHDRACELGAKCNCEEVMMHPTLRAQVEALVLRHPGHANQKVHGNRFGGYGTTKESLRRLKGDKEAREKYKAGARGRATSAREAHTVEKVGTNQYAILRKDKQRLGVASSEEAARQSAKRIVSEIGNINRPASEFPKGTGGKIASIIGDVERNMKVKKPASGKKSNPTDTIRRLVRQL